MSHSVGLNAKVCSCTASTLVFVQTCSFVIGVKMHPSCSGLSAAEMVYAVLTSCSQFIDTDLIYNSCPDSGDHCSKCNGQCDTPKQSESKSAVECVMSCLRILSLVRLIGPEEASHALDNVTGSQACSPLLRCLSMIELETGSSTQKAAEMNVSPCCICCEDALLGRDMLHMYSRATPPKTWVCLVKSRIQCLAAYQKQVLFNSRCHFGLPDKVMRVSNMMCDRQSNMSLLWTEVQGSLSNASKHVCIPSCIKQSAGAPFPLTPACL